MSDVEYVYVIFMDFDDVFWVILNSRCCQVIFLFVQFESVFMVLEFVVEIVVIENFVDLFEVMSEQWICVYVLLVQFYFEMFDWVGVVEYDEWGK